MASLCTIDMEFGGLHVGFLHSCFTSFLRVSYCDARCLVQSVRSAFPRQEVPKLFREGFRSIRHCVLQLHDAVITVLVSETVRELEEEFV
jgi:hypothetical protein